MSVRQIVGGQFQSLAGNPLVAGYITFHLNIDASTGSQQVLAGIITKATLDSNGSISGTVYLWPNDQLTPTNTVYIVKVYTNAGELSWSSENVVPSGDGSFDIGLWVPLY